MTAAPTASRPRTAARVASCRHQMQEIKNLVPATLSRNITRQFFSLKDSSITLYKDSMFFRRKLTIWNIHSEKVAAKKIKRSLAAPQAFILAKLKNRFLLFSLLFWSWWPNKLLIPFNYFIIHLLTFKVFKFC